VISTVFSGSFMVSSGENDASDVEQEACRCGPKGPKESNKWMVSQGVRDGH
jgi:hypothetical protein